MSDPERLLESGADPEVRELLESLRELAPDAKLGLASWGIMAAKVATLPTVVPPPAAAAPSAVGTGISQAIGAKLLAVAMATTVVGAGAIWFHAAHRGSMAVPNPAKAAPSAAPVQSAPPAPAPQDEAANAASDDTASAREPASAPSPSAGTHASRLDAEASLLAKARSALHNGDAHGAALALSQLQSAFPKGALGQEREVLAIEVLAENGNLAAARKRANAFIAAHPSSPHNAKLERFLEAR
ncbi:MAG TPA: outer membrane protein assembly factor BamD [Polyangiaceae bacterium]|jgi:hypothetical protein|nr:outer membrane protein assembly factor BamD [Polyangiaceae bacterium]